MVITLKTVKHIHKKKYCVESFKDENAPEFKDLHPIAQGLRLGELLK